MIYWTVISVASFFTSGGQGNMQDTGFRAFRYYTVDSNVFIALTSIPVIVYLLLGREMPSLLKAIRFSAVVSVMLTFVTVMLFLGMIYGYRMMFAGKSLYMHLLTPLAALLSFLFLEKGQVSFPVAVMAIIPTIIYGIVYIYNTVVIKVWKDFYAFNRGGRIVLSASMMIAGVLVLSLIIRYLNNRIK